MRIATFEEYLGGLGVPAKSDPRYSRALTHASGVEVLPRPAPRPRPNRAHRRRFDHEFDAFRRSEARAIVVLRQRYAAAVAKVMEFGGAA